MILQQIKMNLITLLLLDDIKIPRKIQKDIEKMFRHRMGRNIRGSKKRKDLKTIEHLKLSIENFGVSENQFNLLHNHIDLLLNSKFF